MSGGPGVQDGIFVAATEEDYSIFARLVRDYAAWLHARLADEAWFIDAVLRHQSLDDELNALPKTYGPPQGRVLLAHHNGEIAGGAAYHKLSDSICEMKRMFVFDRFRGKGLGRRLCDAIVASARQDGYRLMQLDTSRKLTEAITMYKSIGFQECPPYREYPEELIPHLLFMERAL